MDISSEKSTFPKLLQKKNIATCILIYEIHFMKVKVARSAGFCIGVKRAVEMVLRIADEHRKCKIYTLGPLIHNPQTVAMLEEKGISVLDDISTTEKGDIVVIRSHGISPVRRCELKSAGLHLFDATCPKVAYVHRIVREYSRMNYAVVIVGDKNHAEVVGIMGETSGPVVAVNNLSQISNLPQWEKVLVVAQTTMDNRTFQSIVAEISRKFDNVFVKNTLCSETSFRQEEIEELAKDADVFVVIGGKNSANTKRLHKLATETGHPTYWVETAGELKFINLEKIERVAVVAGTSTPNWIIADVVEMLESINKRFQLPWRWRWLKNLAYSILRANLYTASAVWLLIFALTQKLALNFPMIRAFIGAFTVFGMLNLYEFREWQGLALMDPSKVQFVRQNRKFILPISIFCLIAAIIASLVLWSPLIIVIIVIILMTFMYWRLPEFEYRLSAVVKDILVSVSWVAVVWILGTAGNVKVVIPLISLMLFRGLILGLKELETDRILQRETITSNLGEKRSLWLGLFLVVISIISMYLAGFAIWVMFTTIILLYILALVVAFVRTRRGTYIEIFTDGIIILCALFLLL